VSRRRLNLQRLIRKGHPHLCEKGLFSWTASGRAIANGRDEGVTKLLFDAKTHRIVARMPTT
jgi:pyruvate/2-oxoglutarate dehydrogenase complex dihydrolipoamide dehydrogenase (E3) component